VYVALLVLKNFTLHIFTHLICAHLDLSSFTV